VATLPLNVRQLRALYARHLAGESTAALASEVGMSVNNLGKRWRRVGCHAAQARVVQRNVQQRPSWLYAQRSAGVPWRVLVAQHGLPDTQASVRLLYMRLRRYCERAGCAMPTGPACS